MPVNTTVSHISPLLNYIPRSAWYELTPESDSILASDLDTSYHATNATVSGSASMTFSWWGQGLWIFGEYREWLGRYRVTLDGSKTEHDGYTGGKERLGDYVLFSAPDLPLGQHHLRITNIGDDLSRPILDIAHLIFQSESGSVDVVEHNSTLCVWTPKIAYAWQVDALSHTTFLSSGAMGMNFTGTGIAIYGPLDASSAPFSVTLDSETHPPLAPNTAVQSPLTNSSTLLFVKTGLFDGPHTLWVENNPVSESPGDGSAATGVTKMSIAQMGVFRDAISTPGNGTTQSSPPRISPRSTVIFAAAFGSLGAFLLAILLWRLSVLYRRRTQRQADEVTARPFLAPGPATPSSAGSTTTLFPHHSASESPGTSPPPGGSLSRHIRIGGSSEKRQFAEGAGGAQAVAREPRSLEPLRRETVLLVERRPSSTLVSGSGEGSETAAYVSVAATAADSPTSPWPPEQSGDGARTRLRVVGSPVPSSLPSGRVHSSRAPRDRGDFQRQQAEANAELQMPPPYRLLDMH